MEEVWRTRDRAGREVVLTGIRLAHILHQHQDMVALLAEVRRAVEACDLVTRDIRYAHRECLYRRFGGDRRWMKVVVHYRPVPPQGTWAGEVITAFPARRVDPKEVPLWP